MDPHEPIWVRINAIEREWTQLNANEREWTQLNAIKAIENLLNLFLIEISVFQHEINISEQNNHSSAKNCF